MKTRFVVDTAGWNSDVAGWTLDSVDNPMLQFKAEDYDTGLIAAEKGDLAAAQKALAGMDVLMPRLH